MSTPLRRAAAVSVPESSGPAEERAWIERIVAGDEAAFEMMFRRYNRELYRFALRMTGSPDEAEEVVQAVFVAVWRNRASWTIRSGLRVYLIGAVRNRVLQQFRNGRVQRRLQPDVLAFTTSHASEPFLGPDAQVQRADFAAALARAVAGLPPRCREAFVLTREHGMTYAEAAATMGISPQTVMVQIGRALTALRKSLAPFLVTLLIVR
jgi:RNA polymerase sigma-70 factor (ECF subfamily)